MERREVTGVREVLEIADMLSGGRVEGEGMARGWRGESEGRVRGGRGEGQGDGEGVARAERKRRHKKMMRFKGRGKQ